MVPAWAASYIGLPFRERGRDRSGIDCFGLLRLVQREQFGLDLPSYAEGYRTTTDDAEIGALVRGAVATDWREIPLAEARPGDALVIRMMGQPMHVGIVVDPPWFLHIERDINACLDRYDGMKWSRRVVGVYRHAARCAAEVSA